MFKIFKYPNALNVNECTSVRLIRHKYKPSQIIHDNKKVINKNIRYCYTSYPERLNSAYLRLNARIDTLMGLNHMAYSSSLAQIVKYPTDGFFTKHMDALNEEDLERYGPQRLWTALLYLNDDFEGGETYFNDIDYTCHPETGKMICWQSASIARGINQNCHHESKIVTKGVKYIAVKLYFKES